jgi:hypothetical protein
MLVHYLPHLYRLFRRLSSLSFLYQFGHGLDVIQTSAPTAKPQYDKTRNLLFLQYK